jgi:hypothetical protein
MRELGRNNPEPECLVATRLRGDMVPHVIAMSSAVSEVLEKVIAQLDASLRTKR